MTDSPAGSATAAVPSGAVGPSASAAPAAPSGTGRYLYVIARGLDPAALAGVAGLEGAPVRAVASGDLVAVVSEVDLEEYGEAGLRRNLERIDWLETVARAHDEVVRTVAAIAPAAPVRLATVCRDDDAVLARLEQWGPALTEALDRVEGRVEWGVKIVAPRRAEPDSAEAAGPAPAGDAGAAGDAGGGSGAGAGAAYLRRKKEQSLARDRAEESLRHAVDEVHRTVAGRSVAFRRLAPQDPGLTGLSGTMLHNGAYLVEQSASDEVALLLRELADRHPGVDVVASGPWPAYSFATLEQP